MGDITYQGGTLYTSTSWEDVELTRSGTTPGIISLDQTVFEAGTREYSWTFIPQDTENYKTAAGRITLTVQTVEAERLEVRGTPVKTEYVYGDTFAPEGTVFTVHYTDGSSRTLQLSEIKFIYENGAFFCAGDTSVTVSSTVNGKVLEAIVEGLTVSPKTVTDPRIVLAVPTEGYVYDETEKEPAVTVYDGDELIPDTEYTVEYSDNLLAGKAEAVIRDNEGGNYAVSGKATFEIAKADQLPLNIYGMPEGNISYRDTFQLSAAGGSGTSELTWKVTSGNEYAVITADGTVTVTGIGDVEITVTKAGDDNYNETSSSWKFSTGKAVPEVGEVTYSGGQLYTCLLYTSDAADD